MKRAFLILALLCMAAVTANAQKLFLNLNGGIMINNGIRGDGIRDAARDYSSPTAGLSLLVDNNIWQAGLAADVYNISNKTQFIFEQDIFVNNISQIYTTSVAAPAYVPYVYGNYKWSVFSDNAYIYSGVRAGAALTTNKLNDATIYNAQNSNAIIYLQSKPAFTYGLQAGIASNSESVISAGCNVAWQTYSTKANVDYTVVYTAYDNHHVPHRYTQTVNKTFPYHINLFSIQIFLRIQLFAPITEPTEVDKPEND